MYNNNINTKENIEYRKNFKNSVKKEYDIKYKNLIKEMINNGFKFNIIKNSMYVSKDKFSDNYMLFFNNRSNYNSLYSIYKSSIKDNINKIGVLK